MIITLVVLIYLPSFSAVRHYNQQISFSFLLLELSIIFIFNCDNLQGCTIL